MSGIDSPFKVLIAGGSVAGLVLANALERAGIDYLVLEKREIAPNLGASISILCHTARVLEQLGMWQTILSKTLPLLDRLHFDENGDLFENTAVLRLLAERTGRPILFVARQVYLQTLLDNIPQSSRSKIQAHKKVESFHEDDEGVTVVTDKGEQIRGSILIGADGVHSSVRDLMANYLEKSDPSRAEKFRAGKRHCIESHRQGSSHSDRIIQILCLPTAPFSSPRGTSEGMVHPSCLTVWSTTPTTKTSLEWPHLEWTGWFSGSCM